MSIGKTPDWVVKELEVYPNYAMVLVFADGTQRIFDAEILLKLPCYEPLKDVNFFMGVYVDGSSVAWSDKIDIAPEYLYEESMIVSDDVSKWRMDYKRYLKSVENTPGPAEHQTCQVVDFQGLKNYADRKGVRIRELTREEKARFIVNRPNGK